MVGKTVSHYKILEKLGEGGMGVVYKAQDLKLDRFVALKFLPPHLIASDEEKQRFIHEAKAASTLEHNNICNIHEIDETDDGQLYISMAYYDGETLNKKVKEKPLPIDQAIDIAIQITQGLTKSHEKGIVHRDIKSSNIFITTDGTVKIIDFGLAKLAGQTKLTKEGTTLGTVAYMSPEQTLGKKVDHRSDIWSLGVLIYEIISGQLPFKGDYDQVVIYGISNEDPVPLTGIRSGVPMELERIVNRALSKAPEDRYQHADDLLSELNRLKKESESGIAPISRVISKKRFKSVILPVVILIIIVLSVVGYLLIPPGEKSTSEWENSIAVLPFDNISADPEQEYFCDGMTEQIISNLAKLPRLKVISRTSVMKYKGSEKTIPEIGQELNVAHVLEGSIRKFGDQIRVTAQLVNSEDDSHLWAEDFDRKLDHVFEVQDDISQLIASRLLSTLSLQEINVIKSNKPANTVAYDFFLKGKYFLHKYERFRQISDLDKSEQMFKNAIEQDPNYAPSYAYLADVYGTYISVKSDQKEKYLTLQEKYTQIAYDLDSLSAVVLHRVAFLYWNKNIPDKRFTYLKKSIASDPNYVGANLSMGIFLRNYGLLNLALKFFNKAAELNPVDAWVYGARATAYTYSGEFDKAEHDYQCALGISSNDYYSLYYYTLLLITLNRYEEANQMFLKFKNSYPTEKDVKYCKSLLLAMQGDSLNAMKLFDQSGLHLYYQVDLHCILDNRNEAISLLNDLLQRQKSRRSRFIKLTNLPLYDNLRTDPRFQEILAKHKKLYEENMRKYGDIDI